MGVLFTGLLQIVRVRGTVQQGQRLRVKGSVVSDSFFGAAASAEIRIRPCKCGKREEQE